MNAERGIHFVDAPAPASPDREAHWWPPVIASKADLDAEIERLAALPAGPRRSLIVHPRATQPGLGFAPAIEVALEVLLPGERTSPRRHSSSMISFCIAGRGLAVVGGRDIDFEQYDTWYVPALSTYWHANVGGELQVRLCYSNAALLEKLGVHWVDPSPPEDAPHLVDDPPATEPDVRTIGDSYLMSYESLISPPVVRQAPLHWPWEAVRTELDQLATLDGRYDGRRLFLLYNPATGRMNGTSPSLFATITIRPPGIVDRPHRHAAAAINYFFSGSGWSRIEGKRYTWEAGDLMFTAPGWAIHNHASGPDPVYELTIQDFPMHLAMDSLLWQEDLKGQPTLLGSHPGPKTNRAR
jgi:gentisate 1,2-dioxygenase